MVGDEQSGSKNLPGQQVQSKCDSQERIVGSPAHAHLQSHNSFHPFRDQTRQFGRSWSMCENAKVRRQDDGGTKIEAAERMPEPAGWVCKSCTRRNLRAGSLSFVVTDTNKVQR